MKPTKTPNMKRFFALSLAAVAMAGCNQSGLRSLKCTDQTPDASSVTWTFDRTGQTYDWDRVTKSWLPTPAKSQDDEWIFEDRSAIVDNVFRLEGKVYKFDDPSEPTKSFTEIDLKALTFKTSISKYGSSETQGTCEWVETKN